MGRWGRAGHATEHPGAQPDCAHCDNDWHPDQDQRERAEKLSHAWQHRYHDDDHANSGGEHDRCKVDATIDEVVARDTAEVTSTADCWNRVREKDLVEGELGLPEYGMRVDLFDASCPGCRVADGYTRVVYGDHGAYVELDPSQVCWESLPVVTLKPSHAYYDEYYTQGGFVRLYKQKRSVEHKKNPPAGGVRHNREGGYADYKVGMCYISPKHLTVGHRPTTPHNMHERRWKK
mmetsp:Transcript_59919/g.111024  ORF Transcript_59919/g.111024 Transcript_59919/m.111024 type:complete len:234 (-) Transcript_59919:118-819(-)